MKKKREIPSRQDVFLRRFLLIALGIVIVFLGVCIFISMLPQNFVIPSELIPTAEYLHKYPEDNEFQLAIRQNYQHDEFLYDICIEMGNGELNYGDNRRTGLILVDRQLPLNTGEFTQGWSVSHCAMGVYLEKGLHLIEYKRENVLFYQKWAIEIE